MVTKRDYYEVLSVARDATADDLKRAYRKLAIELHPDRNPNDPHAEDRFKEAGEAYAVLSDPDRRRSYDRGGHSAAGQAIDASAVADFVEGMLGDLFGGRGKGRQGKDVEVELQLTFEEAAAGAERSVRVESARECSSCKGRGNAPDTVTETCAACSGRGEVRYQRGFIPALRPCGSCKGKGYRVVVPCPTCAGLGTIARPEMISVRTPAGVQNGAVRTIRSAGEYGVGGAGDLLVTIVVKPHEFYRREGSDVLCSVPVTFPELVLGAQIDVPTLEGKVTLKIPPGTPSGKVFRLRGRGLVALGGAGKGDQLVTVDVEVPSEVTPRQRELLAELSTAFGSLPRKQSFLARIRELFG